MMCVSNAEGQGRVSQFSLLQLVIAARGERVRACWRALRAQQAHSGTIGQETPESSRAQLHPPPLMAPAAVHRSTAACKSWQCKLRARRAAAVTAGAKEAHAQDATRQHMQGSSQQQEEDLQQGQVIFEQFSEDGSDPNKELLQSLPPASNIRVKTSEYVSSCVDVASCPAPEFPEFAVIGRSNVGKSSLINMLTNNKRLAHVSKEPGKTRCINHFLINDCWYLVDLPGYGYARTGLATRGQFDRFTKDYFLTRPSLALVYLLVDSSIAPQKIDMEYAAWLHEHQVPYTLVFTKADKRKKGQPPCRENVASFKQQLLEQYGLPFVPTVLITSSETGMGRTPLLHLTCTVRDSFVATTRLDEAMVAWKRRQLYWPSGAAEQDASSSSTGKDSEKNGGPGGKAPSGSTAVKSAGSSKAGSGPAKATAGAAGRKGRAVKPLPGDDIPLPQWKVKASERMAAGQQQRQQQPLSSDG